MGYTGTYVQCVRFGFWDSRLTTVTVCCEPIMTDDPWRIAFGFSRNKNSKRRRTDVFWEKKNALSLRCRSNCYWTAEKSPAFVIMIIIIIIYSGFYETIYNARRGPRHRLRGKTDRCDVRRDETKIRFQLKQRFFLSVAIFTPPPPPPPSRRGHYDVPSPREQYDTKYNENDGLSVQQ